MHKTAAVRVTLLVAAAAVGGCRSGARTASVVVPEQMGGSSVLVQFGRSWNVAQSLPVPLSLGKKIHVPDGSDVVVPFVDLNGNGRLDKLVEPAIDCGHTAGFACELRPARLVVRRTQRQRLGESEDITLVFGESYLTGPLRPDPEARLCQDQPGSCVGRSSRSAYTDIKDALAMKLCAFDDSKAADATQPVQLRSGDRVVLKVEIRRPAAMNLRATLERKGGDLRVTGQADLRVDHLVVWVGRYDPKKQQMNGVRWTSEHPNARFAIAGQGIEAQVPASLLDACPDCVVGVQVAHDVSAGEVAVGTEALVLLRPQGQS